MTEKRKEFLDRLRENQGSNASDLFFAARIRGEEIERDKIANKAIEQLPDKANVFLSKNIEYEYQKRFSSQDR